MSKQFTRKEYAIYEKGNPICMTLRDVDKRLNELYEEKEMWKRKALWFKESLERKGYTVKCEECEE